MLDCTNKFTKAINGSKDLSDAAKQCNKIHESDNREVIETFIDWIKYNDEMFDHLGRNTMEAREIYNRFLDELNI